MGGNIGELKETQSEYGQNIEQEILKEQIYKVFFNGTVFMNIENAF